MVGAGRTCHSQASDHLEHVVLYYIPDGPHLFVQLAATFHAETFGHRDLYALQVLAIPAGLNQRVGKAEINEVQYRLLAEIVVDAEDGRFGKGLVKRAVQLLGRGEIATEWLFHDDARIFRTAGLSQPSGDRRKHAWRDRQIVQRPLDAAERLAQLRKRGRVPVVPINIAEQRAELRKRGRVQCVVFLKTVLGPRF